MRRLPREPKYLKNTCQDSSVIYTNCKLLETVQSNPSYYRRLCMVTFGSEIRVVDATDCREEEA